MEIILGVILKHRGLGGILPGVAAWQFAGRNHCKINCLYKISHSRMVVFHATGVNGVNVSLWRGNNWG